MFLIVYAIIGIPLMAMMLTTFGDKMKHIKKSHIIYFETKILKRSQPQNIQRKSLIAVFVATAVSLSVISAISVKIENWDFSLAFYIWFVTLTTIGFGDYVPKGSGTTNPVRFGLEVVFTVIGFFMSLTLVACILHTLSDWVNSSTPPTKNDLKRSLGHLTGSSSTHREEPVTISKALPRPDANCM